MRRLPLFQFSRDLMGFDYLAGSTLNKQMADFAERIFHAWMKTRNTLRKRVKAMTLIPRKGRKSTIITQAGTAYLLCHDHDLSIVIDSEKKELANKFLGSIKRVVSGETTSPWKDTIGNWYDKSREWRDDSIEIGVRRYRQRKEPSIVTSSVEIGYTGGAPDAIIIDDPMSPESHTDVWMGNVIDHYNGLGPVCMPNGLLWLNMTRYDDMDLAGHIQRTEGWHVCEGPEAEACILAGKCTQETEAFPEPWHVMFRSALTSDSKSIDEVVWPTNFLLTERKKYPAFFAAQYMNNPWHNPDASFQPEDFTYAEKAPQDVVRILTSDIAWKTPTDRKTERAGDWNTFILGEHDRISGKVYVTRIDRGRWTMGEWGDKLVEILRRTRTDENGKRTGIPISRMTYEEVKMAKGAVETAIRSACQRWTELAPALVQAPRSVQANAKQERVKAIAQYFQNHQVIFVRPCKVTEYNHNCPKCENFQVLRNELLKFGATMYDDCADAMADHFLAEVYHAPGVQSSAALPPMPVRPFDDMLKPSYGQQAEWIMTLDEQDRPVWQPTDAVYPRDPI